MANSPQNTQALFSSRMKVPAAGYIGDAGRLFYHEDTGELRLSDGATPGGLPVIASGTITLSGDITGIQIGTDVSTTLTTVNANVGTFGSNITVPVVTVNEKGLITGVSTVPMPSADMQLELYSENGIPTTAPVATGTNAIALGNGSLAQLPGSIARASGIFSQAGDAQAGEYLSRIVTVDGSYTEVFLDGATARLLIPNNCTMFFKAFVSARCSASGEAGLFEVVGGITKDSTAMSTRLVSGVSITKVAADVATWYVQVVADTVNGALGFYVSGEAGKIINWVVNIQTVETIA